jgi:hypothetical protein
MKIYFVGPLPLDAPVFVPGVSEEPIQRGVGYEVDEALAAELLGRKTYWSDQNEFTVAAPWNVFVEIDGVSDSIARAMWNAGLRSRDDVVAAAQRGVLTDISGIGEARALVIATWAQEESE